MIVVAKMRTFLLSRLTRFERIDIGMIGMSAAYHFLHT